MDENGINIESPGVNNGKPEPYDYLSDILLVMNREELTLSAAKDYSNYIKHIAINEMGLKYGVIEYFANGDLKEKGEIKPI